MLLEKIKELCLKHNTTIKQLEINTGIANGVIRKWDKVSPKADSLEKVANYFNVSVDYLLGRTADPSPKPIFPGGKMDLQTFKEQSPGEYETTADELVKKAMELFSQMDEEHKKTALAQLEALAALNRK